MNVAPALALEAGGDSDVVWRSKRVCGLNSLYLLMRHYGLRPDYVKMEKLLVGEELTSFAQMQLYAQELGFPLRIAQFTPAELTKLKEPCICHFEAVAVDGINRGHFVVVTEVTDDHVRCVDGTSMISRAFSWAEFQRKWSGYLAHRVQEPAAVYPFGALASLVIGFGAGWLLKSLCRCLPYRPEASGEGNV